MSPCSEQQTVLFLDIFYSTFSPRKWKVHSLNERIQSIKIPKRGWLIVFGQNTFFWSFCFEDLFVDLKEILNLHQNLFKNKLVGENAVARVHGSCSFRFMGSWHNIIFLLICAGMLAYLRKLVQFFSSFNPCLSTSIPGSQREMTLPGTRLAFPGALWAPGPP